MSTARASSPIEALARRPALGQRKKGARRGPARAEPSESMDFNRETTLKMIENLSTIYAKSMDDSRERALGMEQKGSLLNSNLDAMDRLAKRKRHQT